MEKLFKNLKGKFGLAIAIALLVVFCLFLLMATGLLVGFDDYLTSLIVQYSFSSEKSFPDIVVIKKDQATSELLAKNPSREEFASLFSFLGSSQMQKRPFSSKPRRTTFLRFQLGNIKIKNDAKLSFNNLIINTSYDKWRGTKWLKTVSPSAETVPTSYTLLKFEESFWSEKGSNLLNSLSGTGRKDIVFETLKIDWAKTTQLTDEIEEVLSYSVNLILNLLTSEIKPRLAYRPTDNIWLEFSLALETKGTPSHYEVQPSNIIAFDFVLQGETIPETDKKLELAIQNSKSAVVLAGHTKKEEEFHFDLEVDLTETATSDTPQDLEKVRLLNHSTRLILPAEKFLKNNVHMGMIDMSVGNKSFVTQAPIFIHDSQNQKLEPSFALITAMLALDKKHFENSVKEENSYLSAMHKELERIYPLYVNNTYNGGFKVKDINIPTNSLGNLFIKYVGSTSRGYKKYPVFQSYSLYECLQSDILEELFAKMPQRVALKAENAHKRSLGAKSGKNGKIVLVGPFEASDFDFYPTPLNLNSFIKVQKNELMGIEIHANVLANILENDFLKHPSLRKTILILFFSSLFFALILQFVPPSGGILLLVLFVFSIGYYAHYSYYVLKQVLYFSSMLLSYPAILSLSTLSNYLLQKERATKTKNMFSRFVAPGVVQHMLENPDLVAPGGKKVELTIFFSDVAGFTTISESLSPENLVILLNEYLGAMTDLLFDYGGTLDKFIGDAVMAFWNYPLEQEEHALKACFCALEMQKKIDELQKDWLKRGFPILKARAGLNTAEVVVGIMGSSKTQVNFTCMGDGVNLAARLEGANKEYGTSLMVGESTYNLIKEKISCRFLDLLTVKGKLKPVKVYELVAKKGEEPPNWSLIEKMYDEAIQLHLNREWSKAIALFEEVLSIVPFDGPSQTYLKRCHEYADFPPPPDWDGRYIMTHK